MKNFVLSESGFDTVKEAENKINGWWQSGDLKSKKVKLYKVVEIYDLKLSFKKRRKK